MKLRFNISYLLFILSLLVTANTGCNFKRSGGEKADTFSATQLQQDFKIFRLALEEAHPALYLYKAKKAVDSSFAQVFNQLDSPLTGLNFFYF